MKKFNKTAFWLLIAISFLLVLVFNYATPMLSDDYSYGQIVRGANGIGDLFRQEYKQYMEWNGRSVVHMILRISLFLPNILFKIANSIVFIILAFLMQDAVGPADRHDSFVMLLVQLGLWIGTVDFSQTILWQTGACNYLWGMVIILGFMAAQAHLTKKYNGISIDPVLSSDRAGENVAPYGKNSPAAAILMFVFGVIAGWCNENTSGGSLLFILILILLGVLGKKKIPAFQISGAAGNFIGLMLMVTSPGSAKRKAFHEELHSGLYGMAARFQKITLLMGEYFLPLLCILAASLIILILLRLKNKPDASVREILLSVRKELIYTFLFFAVSYALILSTTPQPRALFGAGIFLLIADITAVCDIMAQEMEKKEIVFRSVIFSAAAGLCIWFFFDIMDCGADMLRIHRDCEERIAYIEEQKAAGSQDITVAQLHEAFQNRYTAAYGFEPEEDPGYWTNVGYEEYYGVESIRAIPYDDWAEMTGRGTSEEETETQVSE